MLISNKYILHNICRIIRRVNTFEHTPKIISIINNHIFIIKYGLSYYKLKRNNLNNKKLLNEYANWIDSKIIEYSNNHNNDDFKLNIKEFVERYGYYITFNFDIHKMIHKYHFHSASHQEINEKNISNVRFIYNLICKNALGRNFMKKTELLPLVIMCSDVNNTKFWSYSGDLTNLHIHSIWISNPYINIDLAQSISGILESDTFGKFDFRDVHIERITSYDATADAPSKIATYTAKFIPFNTRKLDVASDIRMLPEYSY